jgi:hypothetical protein
MTYAPALTQPALAARLREKGLARAARFTWERTAHATIAVVERTMCGRQRRWLAGLRVANHG